MEEKLRKLYLSRSSIDKIFNFLNNEIEDDFNDDNQLLIHSNTFDNETAKQYPLSRSYSLKFLKELIKRIENSRNVVNESIYNDYIELMNASDNDDFHYVHYFVCGQEFTFKQSNKIVDGTTGLMQWCAGFQLFEQIFANKDRIFKNKSILELGSGLGMTGILLISLCELKNYTFTDHHEKVIDLIKDNLKINGFDLNKSQDKKSNKFYQYEDEDGNVSAKYYENDHDNGQFSNSFNMGSFNSFSSNLMGSSSVNFIRQGPMNLETTSSLKSLDRKDEFDFDYKFDRFSLSDKKEEKDENIFNYDQSNAEKDLFKMDLNDRFKKFDEKVENLKNEKMMNFEEFLKSFEEKLSLLDENVKKQKTISTKINKISRNKNEDVNIDVVELDWSSSNDEIMNKLNKLKPNYIIGSDIVFDPRIISDLIRVFRLCLSNLDCGIIIICSIRNEDTIKQFEQQLRQLQNENKNIKIQRNKLSSRLSYFDDVELSNKKFVLYNIRNDDDEEDEDD